MPGLNQKGPSNEGPMTGGRRGVCTGKMDSDQQFSEGDSVGRFRGRGSGRSRGLCRRGCQDNAQSQIFERGLGRRRTQQADKKQ